MKPNYLILFLVVALGAFAALIAWTLIVKQQVTATLAANPNVASTGNLLTALSGIIK
jgi:Flp pilus assembly protein CpaB